MLNATAHLWRRRHDAQLRAVVAQLDALDDQAGSELPDDEYTLWLRQCLAMSRSWASVVLVEDLDVGAS